MKTLIVLGFFASCLFLFISCGNDSNSRQEKSLSDSANQKISPQIDGPQPGLKYETIVLDEKHNQAYKIPLAEIISYNIKECDGILIAPKAYNFNIPDELMPAKIELIQINYGDRSFEADWSENGTVIVDKFHLRMLVGHLPFTGFRAGDEVTLEIGTRIKIAGSRREGFGLAFSARLIIADKI